MQLHTLPTRLKNLENKPVYALIWTTTPWSLVANQAIAFSSDIEYCIVEDNSKNLYILAQQCLASIEQKMGSLKLISTIKGNKLLLYYMYKKNMYQYHIIIMRDKFINRKRIEWSYIPSSYYQRTFAILIWTACHNRYRYWTSPHSSRTRSRRFSHRNSK